MIRLRNYSTLVLDIYPSKDPKKRKSETRVKQDRDDGHDTIHRAPKAHDTIHRAPKAHFRSDCLTPIPLSVRSVMPFIFKN